MRSKASIKGHPIHPALIPFPIAFLIGSFLADLIGRSTGVAGLWTTGAYLAFAGIVMALVAAVPGFIDYFFSVPPRSSGKKRATLHLTVNLSSVALFTVAQIARGGIFSEPGIAQLLLEGAGVVLLTVGGWLGGTLAFRNQIGVDHRYANAGRWQALRLPASAQRRIVVALENELEVNQMKLIDMGNMRVVVARTEHSYVAFDDHCTHRGGSLADGALICGTVQCPWHGSQFDVQTGEPRAGPAKSPIGTYRVEEHEGKLWLELREPASAAHV